jgi:PST family polysaccharide transporter/lipopolysaccharide exporter
VSTERDGAATTTSTVVGSLIWAAGQNTLGRVIQLAMFVVLARLIGPHAIGVIGIVLLSINALRHLTNIGIHEALVQQPADDVDDYLDTAWVLGICRGLLITAAVFLAAPLLAGLFGAPAVTDLVRVAGLSPTIVALRNPGTVYFQKALDFRRLFVYRVTGDAVQCLVAVGYALLSPTAWSFVLGFLAGNVTRSALSYVIHDYRPRPRFDRDRASEIIDYGKWMTGNSILYFLYAEGDDAFVGWLLTPVALGYYQYAYKFSNAPATEISEVISSVLFPTFSKVQDDTPRLRDAFCKTLRLTAVIAFPMAFGIVVVAPSFVAGVLGEQWLAAVPAMQVLAIFGLSRAISKAIQPVWKAVGRPDYVTKISALRVLLIAVVIYPATATYGVVGTAVAVTAVSLVPILPLELHVVARTIEIGGARLASELAYPLAASLVMAGGTWYAAQTLALPAIARTIVLPVLGAVIYVPMVFLIDARFDWGVQRNLTAVIGSVRR